MDDTFPAICKKIREAYFSRINLESKTPEPRVILDYHFFPVIK